ncbi:MAG TPA: tRNA (N(6)-L-threonylcarbamoyladenosine(37)-C(2))-methylthiotransferase MtaB [Candidatus Acidoferrum sp.]|nr:tRNA (N(6)-L-threonylcarbamoyladenosine(37)-C(2))-methylthiotransferase MtaB [Candidatus Acidoferrum sp.]
MTTFSIHNFGCRATEADAASLRQALLSNGLRLTDDQSAADVVVLNTCTVTGSADAQAREAVRKIHRTNPSARIVVSGCYAQRAPEEVAVLPGVALVVGNSHIAEIPDIVSGPTFASSSTPNFVAASEIVDPPSLARAPAKILTSDIFASGISLPVSGFPDDDRTRPILKIQDGCNHRCSYCVIPFVRGRSRSVPPNAVVEQVRNFVDGGAKEIVLSGINLGSYGRDLSPRTGLQPLVRRILAETEIERLRFSSIEPQDVTQDFIDMVALSDRIAPHFHVPLQAGSDRILRAMHRWYRAAHYAERIRYIRQALPHAAIGADVIAGFPGETEDDFARTADLVERLPFTYLHAFSFSQRPGTEAARLGGAVSEFIVRTRARRLRAIGALKTAAFRKLQRSAWQKALTLHRSGDDWTECLTSNYLRVRIGGRVPANRWCWVRVTGQAEEISSECRLLDDPGCEPAGGAGSKCATELC